MCLGIIGVIIGVPIQSKRTIYEFKHRYDNLTLFQLQQRTGIGFPPSTRIVCHSAIVGLSGELRVKLEMNKKDAESFTNILEAQAHRDNAEISRTDSLGIDTLGYEIPKWWQPRSPRRFVAVRFRGDVQVVFVDLDKPDVGTVYLLWAH